MGKNVAIAPDLVKTAQVCTPGLTILLAKQHSQRLSASETELFAKPIS
jgi:hypothetical protein